MLDRFKSLIPSAGDRKKNEEIAEILAAKFLQNSGRTDGRSYDSMMKGTLTNLVMQSLIPWFVSCIRRYTEADFHTRMDANFDFVADWKDNHGFKYRSFVAGARAIRHRFKINADNAVEGIVMLLEREGWTVRPDERVKLLVLVKKVELEIYGR